MAMLNILSVDIGTSALKMGVFVCSGDTVKLIRQTKREYSINIFNDGLFSEIKPEKWQKAFESSCREMQEYMAEIDVVSFSGTTPGLTAMNSEGETLYPAILMLDQRSRIQAQHIINTIGMKSLLENTANMPISGGCSLSSILWIKDNLPNIFHKTYIFGHSNTFMTKWLTGKFAMDPSSASLTAMYSTVKNDLTWDQEILSAFGLNELRLPELIHAYSSAGRVKKEIASYLGLRKEPVVLIGGNDAVLAAFSLGIKEPGEVFNINGTCEITMVCLPECFPSENYNIRNHVIPKRWFSFYVMNAGGKALEWFKNVLCQEMSPKEFYDDFLPQAIDKWLDKESGVTYIPYLMGSRYSMEPLKAQLQGITFETSREELLAALVRGLCTYQNVNLQRISSKILLKDEILVSGGAVNPAIIRAKTRWMRNCEYKHETESSLKGAAMLGILYMQDNI